MKHTKGPWKAEKTGLIYQETTNRGVARLVSIGTEQDAHLIAAAPDLLQLAIELSEETTLPENSYYKMLAKQLLKKVRG